MVVKFKMALLLFTTIFLFKFTTAEPPIENLHPGFVILPAETYDFPLETISDGEFDHRMIVQEYLPRILGTPPGKGEDEISVISPESVLDVSVGKEDGKTMNSGGGEGGYKSEGGMEIQNEMKMMEMDNLEKKDDSMGMQEEMDKMEIVEEMDKMANQEPNEDELTLQSQLREKGSMKLRRMISSRNSGLRSIFRGDTNKIVDFMTSTSHAPRMAFPYVVTLIQNRRYRCGGMILDSRRILSAAHCFFNDFIGVSKELDVNGMEIVAGEQDRSKSNEFLQIKRINRVCVHSAYNPNEGDSGNEGFDIGIAYLDEPLDLTAYGVASAPMLPLEFSQNDEAQFTDEDAMVSGWGRINTATVLSKIMQFGHVPLQLNGTGQNRDIDETCSNYSGPKGGGICAGGGNVSEVCSGDDGGPLECEIKETGKFYACGILSKVKPCSTTVPNEPAFYTRISHFRNWINGYDLRRNYFCSNVL